MKLQPFHLYLEALGVIWKKTDLDLFPQTLENIRSRAEKPELVPIMAEPCQKMLEVCADITLPDSPLFQVKRTDDPMESRPFQEFFISYYNVEDPRPPLEQMLSNIREEGNKVFLSCVLDIDDANTINTESVYPPQEEMLKQLRVEDFSTEYRAAVMEIALFPEIYAAQLAGLLEEVAQRIAPVLDKYQDRFQYAEDFFAAPDLQERMQKRVRLGLPDNTFVTPSLSMFNMGWSYQPICSKHFYFMMGILFCATDIFSQTELTGEQISNRMKVLGDPTRLEILRILGETPTYQADLAKRLKLTTPTISHHMSLLIHAGFINDKIQDNRIYYHLNTKSITTLSNSLVQHLGLK
ncbi:MAG: ArsR/SmtB family transcription factor [Candidatus Merdivicinus sp.]|jgi:DNA-binding transcriptional ArsR family regulator